MSDIQQSRFNEGINRALKSFAKKIKNIVLDMGFSSYNSELIEKIDKLLSEELK